MKEKTHSPSSGPYDHMFLFSLAALFEKDFSIDWIVELSEEKPSQILSVFETGVKQGFLKNNGKGIYCFSNMKKKSKWEEFLPPEKRALIHRSIANLFMKELPFGVETLRSMAYHLIRAVNDVESCKWLSQAADTYMKAYQTGKALQCYEKILNDLSGLQGEEADTLFTDVTIKYCKFSTARHDTKKMISIINEAITRAKRWNKREDEILLQMNLAKNEWFCSDYTTALKHFKDAWVIAEHLNNSRVLRSVTTFSAYFFYWQGRFREAVQSYEKNLPNVEKLPRVGFPLYSALTSSVCYAYTGQITQGLGLLDNIRTLSIERKDHHLLAYATNAIGHIMLDIRRTEDAVYYLENSIKEAEKGHNKWIQIVGRLMLSFAYFLNGETKRSVVSLRKFINNSNKLHLTVQAFTHLMDLCWLMEQKRMHPVKGLSLSKEIRRMIESENIFMKGVAYRYESLIWRKEALPHEKIVQNLKLSVNLLKESGAQVELVKSLFELAREYFSCGDETSGKESILEASNSLLLLGEFGEGLVPDDLKSLLSELPQGKTILKEILELGEEIITTRDNKELVHRIISKANKITGAERGAIFLINGDSAPPSLSLKGSKNLTPEQIEDPSFASSKEMVHQVAFNGKGHRQETGTEKMHDDDSTKMIRSRICVPMVFREKVVGVLYHDNRLLSNAFKKSDIELISYFAALAAIALDNAKAYEEIKRLNQKLEDEKTYFEEQHLMSLQIDDIVGESLAIKEVLSKIRQVAGYASTVLILGESGVGKELVARAIHRQSPRADKPFIRVNISALPASLIESELFGHEKGSFTGAVQRRIGRFELADGGTIFLDEIGELPLEIQVRLLHVLQDGKFERVGGSDPVYSNFRLLAATNRDLEREVKKNRFRLDLFYRLNVFPIYIPPLRERREDIPLLAHYFLKLNAAEAKKSFGEISNVQISKLVQYDWPGNVRELQNIIERGVILSREPRFQVPEIGNSLTVSNLDRNVMSLRGIEKRQIRSALEKTRWKIRGPGGAAELLDIHPSTLMSRMKKLEIHRPIGIPKIRAKNSPDS